MKKLDLNALGVEEMGTNETSTINGGWFFAGLAMAILFDALLSGGESVDALEAGYNKREALRNSL